MKKLSTITLITILTICLTTLTTITVYADTNTANQQERYNKYQEQKQLAENIIKNIPEYLTNNYKFTYQIQTTTKKSVIGFNGHLMVIFINLDDWNYTEEELEYKIYYSYGTFIYRSINNKYDNNFSIAFADYFTKDNK